MASTVVTTTHAGLPSPTTITTGATPTTLANFLQLLPITGVWGMGGTYSNIQDTIGNAHFVMYNMTAADIVNDTP